jgi:diguanylate cyclase (GGDEF)-like protein
VGVTDDSSHPSQTFGAFVDNEEVKVFPDSSPIGRHLRAAVPANRLVRWLLAIVALGITAEFVETTFVPNLLVGRGDTALYLSLMTGASAIAIARSFARREERLAWITISAALVSNLVAELYTSFLYPDGNVPYPSLADVFYLATYPLMGAGIVLLVRSRLNAHTKGLWLDGLTAGLATAALAATVLAPVIADATTGSRLEIMTNLAYPLGDLLLVFMTTLGLALTGWRPDPALIAVVLANVVTCVADAIYLMEASGSGYVPGTTLDVLWPLGVLLWAVAAWQAPGRRRAPVLGGRLAAVPVLFAAIALGTLGWFVTDPRGRPGAVLAIAAIVLVMVRFTLTQHESIRLLERARTDSLIDPLTGLGNRRALWLHLEERHAPTTAVAMLDLDGFKAFNDRFGHAAGDALLVQTSEHLMGAVPQARVFRLGGDEFCIVGGLEVEALGAQVIGLTGPDDGFDVMASLGVASMPLDTDDPDTAMRLADERMYANKLSRRLLRSENPFRDAFVVSDAGRTMIRA